jgi:hypothetical protein
MKTTTMTWQQFLNTEEGESLSVRVGRAMNSLALGKRKYRAIGTSWDMGLYFAFPNIDAMSAHAEYCERTAARYAAE